jgi:hypothetical protein
LIQCWAFFHTRILYMFLEYFLFRLFVHFWSGNLCICCCVPYIFWILILLGMNDK